MRLLINLYFNSVHLIGKFLKEFYSMGSPLNRQGIFGDFKRTILCFFQGMKSKPNLLHELNFPIKKVKALCFYGYHNFILNRLRHEVK